MVSTESIKYKVNWPSLRVSQPTFRASALRQNVSFETLYGGYFTLSTQFIILNYPVIPELGLLASYFVLNSEYPPLQCADPSLTGMLVFHMLTTTDHLLSPKLPRTENH